MDYYDSTNLLTTVFYSLDISKLKDAICILFYFNASDKFNNVTIPMDGFLVTHRRFVGVSNGPP